MKLNLGRVIASNSNSYGYLKAVTMEEILLDALRLENVLKTAMLSESEPTVKEARRALFFAITTLFENEYPFSSIPDGELIMLSDPYLGQFFNKRQGAENLEKKYHLKNE